MRASMSSAIYQGRVRHTRLVPFQHSFSYRVYYLLVDVDELSELDSELRLFSHNRHNLFSLHSSDHGPLDGSSLKSWAIDRFEKAGVDAQGSRVSLLAFPRVLGYVFNPLSIWYCHSSDGTLLGVMHEVRNTFGDSHVYVVGGRDAVERHDLVKEMHVSPFNGIDQDYHFELSDPAETLVVRIGQTGPTGRVFEAEMHLRRVALSDRALAIHFATHPLLTLKVMAAIHWQALRLWLKGGEFHRRPAPPPHRVTTHVTTDAR